MTEPEPPRSESTVRPSTPLVVSVVLAYNNFDDTNDCLRSLLAQDYARHSVILVDNGSTDGSGERIEEAWGGSVETVRNGSNLGVAGGYNAGVAAALDSGADYVVTCNNDIVVAADFVSSLVGAMAEWPDAAIAVPVMLYFDRPELVWSAGVRQVPGLFLSRNLWRNRPVDSVTAARKGAFESDYVPTCASIISRRALDDVGLFDDRFFFGHDDVDWCLRARRKGLRCLVIPQALVRHKVSVTSGVRGSNVLSPRSAYTHAFGSVLVGAKHFSGTRAPLFLAGLFLMRAPYIVATMALSGAWSSIPSYLRGLAAGMRSFARYFLRAGTAGGPTGRAR